MPRSRLLSSLVRLAKDFRCAEEHHVSPQTIHEWRAERRERDRQTGVDRRSLLAGATAVAAATLAPKAFAAIPQKSVAIIGGGIAGLACALKLTDKGLTDVTVYEANTRLGGRMHSNVGYFANGQTSEWCGELIDTGHVTIQALASRFNLPLADLLAAEPVGSEDTYFFNGCYYPRSQAIVDFLPVWRVLKQNLTDAGYPTTYDNNNAAGRALDNTSVYDWIEQNVPGGHCSPLGLFLDVAYTEELATDTRLQSSLNLIYLLAYQNDHKDFDIFGVSDERYHCIGGNDQIPLAIAASLGGAGGAHIKTGYALTSIKQKPDGRFTTTYAVGNGTFSTTTDYLVLALPFSILRDLDYSNAGFDALKSYAIQNLGAGHSGKLQLQFNHRIWNQTGPWPGVSNGNIYTDLGFQNSWDVTRAQSGTPGILVDYTGGPVASALSARAPYSFAGAQGVSTDAHRYLDGLEHVYPGITNQWNGKAASSVPHLDPFLKLSYSNWRLGQYQHFAGYEGVRQGNCFFAGEHTSVDFQGFMEGGALTGTQTGKAIVLDIRGP